jgi:hypothetical protein
MQFPSRRTNSPRKEWHYLSVDRKNSPGAIFPSDGRIDSIPLFNEHWWIFEWKPNLVRFFLSILSNLKKNGFNTATHCNVLTTVISKIGNQKTAISSHNRKTNLNWRRWFRKNKRCVGFLNPLCIILYNTASL